jgi:Fe-S-cluster-containing hydrogenase component 2
MNILSVLESRRCLDCGKCTSACPVARYNHSLSPRRIVRKLGFPHGASGASWAARPPRRRPSGPA